MLKSRVKQKAIDNMHSRPSKIVRTEVSTLESTVNLTYKDVRNASHSPVNMKLLVTNKIYKAFK